MQYIYDENASRDTVIIHGYNHKYLFKVRRLKIGDSINLRNLNDNILYTYEVSRIERRTATLELREMQEKEVKPNRYLHIGWCVVDPKIIEKTLASLNELGVSKLSFIYADYSQRNFKINFERLENILINSSVQCGRSQRIEFEVINSVEEFLNKYPESYMFNFSQNKINDKKSDIDTIVVGPEGGFSYNEVNLFKKNKIVGIDSNIIQRSETALTCISSIILF